MFLQLVNEQQDDTGDRDQAIRLLGIRSSAKTVATTPEVICRSAR